MPKQPGVSPRGELIRTLRAACGYETQEEFAKAADDLDVRLLRQAEQGKEVTVKTMKAIHAALAKCKPELRYEDLIVFPVGWRKEKGILSASVNGDVVPLSEYIRTLPNVEYVAFIRFRTGSLIIEFDMVPETVTDTILPALRDGMFDELDIEAIYLPNPFATDLLRRTVAGEYNLGLSFQEMPTNEVAFWSPEGLSRYFARHQNPSGIHRPKD